MENKYVLKAEVVTPVHIGAGQEKKMIKNLDFFYRDRKLIMVDTTKIFKALDEKDRARFTTRLASGSLDDFESFLTERCSINIDDFKIAEIDCPGSAPMPEVLPLISSAGKTCRSVYIPGSSLKGAIRSVLFAFLKENNMGKTEEDIFGKIDRNLMSYIQVGDAQFKTSRIINSKIYNLHFSDGEWSAGWKHDRRNTDSDFNPKDFITSYEVFGVKEKANITLKINKERIEYIRNQQSKMDKGNQLPPNHDFLSKLNINDLFGIINWHTKRYLKAEKAFFELYDNREPYCEDIINTIEKLLSMIPEDKSRCLMNLGCGSGFHAITGDWQFSGRHTDTGVDLRGKIRYKSRKFVFRKLKGKSDYDFMPMGFIGLSVSE